MVNRKIKNGENTNNLIFSIILASSSDNSEIDGGEDTAPPSKRQRLNLFFPKTSSSSKKMAMNISENSKNGFKIYSETNGKLNGTSIGKNLSSDDCHSSNGTTETNHSNSLVKNFSQGQKDILRLIGQHLKSLGLHKTTECLINESDCILENPTATNFRNLIVGGKWNEVFI